jgi:hypothetical protein
MKKIIVLVLLAFGLNTVAQKGEMFPVLEGTNLAGKYIGLPYKNGKKTVVGIAYSRAAEKDLKKWLNPLYNTFMVKPGDNKNFDVAEIYDVNFVFIPVIAGMQQVIDDFKAGTDKEFWPYIMDTKKAEMKKIRESIKASDEKIPYFYVVDTSGKIIECVTGAFSEEKMDKLEEAAE